MSFSPSSWFPLIFAHTWQLTILLLLVWGLTRLLRRRPHLGYVVCLVMVLKCLLPPFWASPTGVFSWIQSEQTNARTANTNLPNDDSDLYVFTAMGLAKEEDSTAETKKPETNEWIALPTTTRSVLELPSEPSVIEKAPLFPIEASTILVSIWLVVTLSLGILWGLQIIRFRRQLHRQTQLCSDPQVLAILNQLRVELGIRRQVRLLETSRAEGPASFGVWRPTILLPSHLISSLDAQQLQLVLAHELIHIRRGDLFHAFLQVGAQILWWFHPLVWRFNRTMTQIRERCCDQEVLASLKCDPEPYADCLLQILKTNRQHKQLAILLAHPTMVGSRPFHQTRERIEEIMNEPKQSYRRTPMYCWLFALALAIIVLPGAARVLEVNASEWGVELRVLSESATEQLTPISNGFLTLDQMDSPTSVEVSPDGKHVYIASWKSGTITIFERNIQTGILKGIDTLKGLDGAVHLQLSPDGKMAIVTCIHSAQVILYGREEHTGKWTLLDHVRGKEMTLGGEPLMQFPTEAVWSQDGKFIYVGDAVGSGNDPQTASGQIVILQVEQKKKLKVVDVFLGSDRCFANLRGLTFHPDGITLFAVGSAANTLVVMDRDANTGKLHIRQIVDTNVAEGLHGAMQVACSSDGQHVYVTSSSSPKGNAVMTFKLGSNGKVRLVQSLSNKNGDLPGFEGGNKIRISSDDRTVYVSATDSNHLASFQRDQQTGTLKLQQLLGSKGLPNSPSRPNGLALSPDGKHLYVTWESSKAVSVLERKREKVEPRSQESAKPNDLTSNKSDKTENIKIILERIKAESMANHLRKEFKDQVLKIDVDQQTNSLMIYALPGSVKSILNLTRFCDSQSSFETLQKSNLATLPERTPSTAILKLKYHKAEIVHKLVSWRVKTFSNYQLQLFEADPITNSIIIKGYPDIIQSFTDEIMELEQLAKQDTEINKLLVLKQEEEKKRKQDQEEEQRRKKKMEQLTVQIKLLELDLMEAEIEYQTLKEQLELSKQQHQKGLVYKEELRMKEYAVQKSKIAIDRARLRLEMAKSGDMLSKP